MQRYSRIPAIVILAAAGLGGGVYVHAQRNAAVDTKGSVGDLEAAIAAKGGDVPVDMWLAYADKLRETGRAQNAVTAYKTLLARAPDNRAGRIGYVLALAQAKKTDDLFAALNELTYADPKLAVELLDHAECRPYLSQDRFAALQKEARVQGMD